MKRAAEVLRRRWLEGGYYLLARHLNDWEMVLAMAELAPRQVRQGPPPVPHEGEACQLQG